MITNLTKGQFSGEAASHEVAYVWSFLPSQFPPEITVEFALSLAFLVDFQLAFLLAGLFPLLIFGPGFAQHIGEPAAYVPSALPRLVIMLLARLSPGNPFQALLDRKRPVSLHCRA
jgi:hypothetical protein